MVHTESAPTELHRKPGRIGPPVIHKALYIPRLLLYDVFWIFLSTFYYLKPFHRSAVSARASFSSLQEHFTGQRYQVKPMATHASSSFCLYLILWISFRLSVCVPTRLNFFPLSCSDKPDMGKLEGRLIRRPVFPADLGESSVKGSTRAVLILQL